MSNVQEVDFKKAYPVEEELYSAIKDIVYSFAGRISNVSAIGVLEVAAHDLRKELLD